VFAIMVRVCSTSLLMLSLASWAVLGAASPKSWAPDSKTASVWRGGEFRFREVLCSCLYDARARGWPPKMFG
jgi:hypothetical protein